MRRSSFTVAALRVRVDVRLDALREVVRIHSSGGTGTAAVVMGYTRNDIKTWSNLMARMLVAGGGTADGHVAPRPRRVTAQQEGGL